MKAITTSFILAHVLLAVETTRLPLAGDSGAQVLRGKTERKGDDFLLSLSSREVCPFFFFCEYPISEDPGWTMGKSDLAM